MANNCAFLLKAVSKSKENLDRLVKIMNYEDEKGWHLCRIFSADVHDTEEVNGLYAYTIGGDCAWSVGTCMTEGGYFDNYRSTRGILKCPSKWKSGGKEKCAEIVVTMPQLCELLDMGVEIWSEEEGCQFQEHMQFYSPEGHKNGHTDVADSKDWSRLTNDDGEYIDKDGNVVDDWEDAACEEGMEGFDDYGEFATVCEIYGRGE